MSPFIGFFSTHIQGATLRTVRTIFPIM